jgi:hypothetical protein
MSTSVRSTFLGEKLSRRDRREGITTAGRLQALDFPGEAIERDIPGDGR